LIADSCRPVSQAPANPRRQFHPQSVPSQWPIARNDGLRAAPLTRREPPETSRAGTRGDANRPRQHTSQAWPARLSPGTWLLSASSNPVASPSQTRLPHPTPGRTTTTHCPRAVFSSSQAKPKPRRSIPVAHDPLFPLPVRPNHAQPASPRIDPKQDEATSDKLRKPKTGWHVRYAVQKGLSRTPRRPVGRPHAAAARPGPISARLLQRGSVCVHAASCVCSGRWGG